MWLWKDTSVPFTLKDTNRLSSALDFYDPYGALSLH